MAVDETRKRFPREVREPQMLESAIHHFASSGFHEASMEAIAADAGISKPMIYAYFGSKQDLYVACIEDARNRLIESVAEATKEGLGAEERLWRGCQCFFRFVADHRDSFLVLTRDAGAPADVFAQQSIARREQAATLVAGLLVESARKETVERFGQFLPDFALGIVGAAETIAMSWDSEAGPPPEAMAATVVNFVWHGLDRLNNGDLWRPPTA